MTEVDYDRFVKFVKNYPVQLFFNLCLTGDPAIKLYQDYSNPSSPITVAKIVYEEKDKYFIDELLEFGGA